MSGPPPLIVIGASAGGIEAIRRLLPTLPADLPAAVAVALHRAPVEQDDRLPRVLAGSGSRLPVEHARDGEPIEPAHVYVAPPAVHLEVAGGRFVLRAGPRENGSRPAIDALFRTAAAAGRNRVAGVILSGFLDDGVAGLAAIVARGGRAFVQDPADATFGDMPRNALANVTEAAVRRADEFGTDLVAFAREAATVALNAADPAERVAPSAFTCPACGGMLSEVHADGVERYRCRTGHAYSPRTLYERHEDVLETALWTALRALEERVDFSERLAERSRRNGFAESAERFIIEADTARRRADVVRAALGGADGAQADGAPPLSRRS